MIRRKNEANVIEHYNLVMKIRRKGKKVELTRHLSNTFIIVFFCRGSQNSLILISKV